MSKSNASRGIPKEQLEQSIKTTPQARLRWLEEAQDFVRKTVSPEKIERWRKINGH